MMNTNYIANKIKSERWILLRTHEWTLFHARAAKTRSTMILVRSRLPTVYNVYKLSNKHRKTT